MKKSIPETKKTDDIFTDKRFVNDKPPIKTEKDLLGKVLCYLLNKNIVLISKMPDDRKGPGNRKKTENKRPNYSDSKYFNEVNLRILFNL